MRFNILVEVVDRVRNGQQCWMFLGAHHRLFNTRGDCTMGTVLYS
jgi:hypothetical protein